MWGDEFNLGNPYAYVAGNPLSNSDPSGLYCFNVFKKSCRKENGNDLKRDSGSFGTALASFVPIPQTDWARERVKTEFKEFNDNPNIPTAVKFGAEMLGPPQTRTEAGLFLALSVIPGGGKMVKAMPLLRHTDEAAHATKWLDDLAEQATQHSDEFRDATRWVPHARQRAIGVSDDVAKLGDDAAGYRLFRNARYGDDAWDKAGNQAWIAKGIARGETFKIVTESPWNKLYNEAGIYKGELRPFGHEMTWLRQAGYVFKDGYMVPGRFLA